MNRLLLIGSAFICLSAQAAEDPGLAQIKGYQQQLGSGVDYITKEGAESQKGTSDQLNKIKAYWGDFHEYKDTPVEDNSKYTDDGSKYRNTRADNPTIYK